MRRLALLLALAVAAPAVAQPPDRPPREQRDRDRDHNRDRNRDRDRDRDRRDLDRRHERYDFWQRRSRDVHRRWHTLNVRADARMGRTVISMPFYIGTLDDVRIENAYGMPFVTRVEINYEGRVQTFWINSRLTPGQGIEIRLDPFRAVRTIVVYTNPRFGGGVSIWGG